MRYLIGKGLLGLKTLCDGLRFYEKHSTLGINSSQIQEYIDFSIFIDEYHAFVFWNSIS
jgi:hypothetical protein